MNFRSQFSPIPKARVKAHTTKIVVFEREIDRRNLSTEASPRCGEDFSSEKNSEGVRYPIAHYTATILKTEGEL